MIVKVFGACIGALTVLTFGVFAFWPALMDGVTAANVSYNAASNYTGLNQAIRFTPLFLILGVLSIPVVVIILVIWARRQGVV